MSVAEGFALIDDACEWESSGRYQRAVTTFDGAGRVLRIAASKESVEKRRTLLEQKAEDCFRWSRDLQNWIDNGKKSHPPRRQASIIQRHV